MTRTKLDDAHWASLMRVIQRIPHAWKRDESAPRRFIAAVLWVLRAGVPWRDRPERLGHWPSVYHRFRRWCVRGWWERLFEHRRAALPADGLVRVDSTTCKAHRAASAAAHSTADTDIPVANQESLDNTQADAAIGADHECKLTFRHSLMSPL